MVKRLWFGPAGKPISYKKSNIEKVPEFLREIGLDAFEYEAVRGVKISEKKARKLGEEAEKNSIIMSLHAPYFINLASKEPEKVEASIKRIIQSMIAAEWMNAYVVVIHTGYYKGWKDKKEALKQAIEGYKRVLNELPSWVKKPSIGPEVMGRRSAIGDLEEVIEICREIGERCRPTVDWAHLHARYLGDHVRNIDDVLLVIEKIEKELGTYAVKPLHTHFSKIEFNKGGEKEHHTLAEEYGPEWDIVCRGYIETGIEGVIISESPILEQDALLMKKVCNEIHPGIA